jgi:hypothetical protein
MCNHRSCGKEINITYPECVLVALVMKHSKCMHHITLSPATCMALPYISTVYHKRQQFWEKKYVTYNVCFDFLYFS